MDMESEKEEEKLKIGGVFLNVLFLLNVFCLGEILDVVFIYVVRKKC